MDLQGKLSQLLMVLKLILVTMELIGRTVGTVTCISIIQEIKIILNFVIQMDHDYIQN